VITILEERTQRAILVFDLEDRFARNQGVRGLHPRPIEPIRFYLVSQTPGNGGLQRKFEPPWEMQMTRNPSGYHLFFDTVKLPNGALRQAQLATGELQVRLQSPVYLTQEITVTLPYNPAPYRAITLDLLPSYLYPFPQYGSTLLNGYVQHADPKQNEGVAVSAVVPVIDDDQPGNEQVTFITDAAGQWVLTFPNNTAFPTNGAQAHRLAIQVHFTQPNGNQKIEPATIEQGKITYLGKVELS
jgi:hypothetical protein